LENDVHNLCQVLGRKVKKGASSVKGKRYYSKSVEKKRESNKSFYG